MRASVILRVRRAEVKLRLQAEGLTSVRCQRCRPSQQRVCTLRVVLIDSDRRLGELLQSVLGGDGHQLVPYASPSAGRAELGSADVVIVDLGMAEPASALEELGAAFTAAGADLILVSSTHGAQDTYLRSLMGNLGARAFFRKPFSMLDLSDRLREIDQERRSRGTARTVPPIRAPDAATGRGPSTGAPARVPTRPPAYLAVTSPEVTIVDPDESESVV